MIEGAIILIGFLLYWGLLIASCAICDELKGIKQAIERLK